MGRSGDPNEPQPRRVVSAPVAYQVWRLLHDNIVEGTGTAAYTGCPGQGGKTGTTDNFTDAWFAGIQPNLATVVWVGYPQSNAIEMTSVHGETVYGGTFPAEIWHSLYSGAEVPCEEFSEPEQKISWAPFFGRYTAGAPGSGGSDFTAKEGRAAKSEAERLGKEATGGYDPNAYAPGVGQEPTHVPPPPPEYGSGGRGGRRRQGRQVSRLWAAIVVLVAGFAAAPVLLSHDVYSYVDYARLGVLHGLDPYVHRPAEAPLDPVYVHVTWTGVVSAYGPLFTLATYPLAWLPVWWAVAALKATAALSVLAIAALVARIAPSRGVSPLAAAAFVALNPLVLIHVVGGAHNDGLAMLAATLGVAAMLSTREASAGAAFLAAFAIKAPAAIAAPFALVSAARLPLFSPAEWGKCSNRRGQPPARRATPGRRPRRRSGDRRRGVRRLRLALAARDRAAGAPPAQVDPHERPQHPRPPHRPGRVRGPRRRARPLRRRLPLPAHQNLARHGLAPRRRVGERPPPPGHRLAPPLVPDLGSAIGRPVSRQAPPAPDPRPDRLPVTGPNAALSLEFGPTPHRNGYQAR